MIILIPSFNLMLISHIDHAFGGVVECLYGPWPCFRCGGPWSFVLRGYGWYKGFVKAVSFALSLAANWGLGTAVAHSCFSQQSRVVSLPLCWLCSGEGWLSRPSELLTMRIQLQGPSSLLGQNRNLCWLTVRLGPWSVSSVLAEPLRRTGVGAFQAQDVTHSGFQSLQQSVFPCSEQGVCPSTHRLGQTNNSVCILCHPLPPHEPSDYNCVAL